MFSHQHIAKLSIASTFFFAIGYLAGSQYASQLTWRGFEFHAHNTNREKVVCGTFDTVLNTPSKVWVTFGTDLQNLQYAANAPLSAYIWRHHMNFQPIVFVVGNVTLPHAKILVRAIEDAGAKVEIIEPIVNHSTATLAQIVRIAAFALPYISQNDYIITSDADIWPMSKTFWSSIFDFSKHFTIVNGEFFRGGIGGEVGIAMCYVGGHALAWRAMIERSFHAFPETLPLNELQCNCSNQNHLSARQIALSILTAGKQFRKEKWNNAAKGGDQWYWDQIFITYAFRHAVKHFNASYHLGSGLGSRRLDRSGWRFAGNIESHTDAHLIFPVSSDSVRQRLMVVWKAMFGNTSWPELYLTEYMKSLAE